MTSARLQKWTLILSGINYTVEHMLEPVIEVQIVYLACHKQILVMINKRERVLLVETQFSLNWSAQFFKE